MVKKEKTLYEIISKVVVDWTIKQNKKGKKPLQSTVIGTLDMVKSDWYIIQSIDRVLSDKLQKLVKEWKGKKFEIDHNGTITSVAIKEKKE